MYFYLSFFFSKKKKIVSKTTLFYSDSFKSMNDRYQSFNQEDPDYPMLHPTSSPTSSSSSPTTQVTMTTPMHWQPIAFPFDQQQHMPWATTHPQQHQHSYFQHHPQQQLQQQYQLQQQFHHDLWTSQPTMQEQDYHPHHQQQQNHHHQDPYPILFPQEQVHYFSPPPPLPISLPPLSTTTATHIPPAISTQPLMENQTKSSPNLTPIPSPTETTGKRKRDKQVEGTTKRSKGNSATEEEGGTTTITTRTRLKGNLKVVDHLERELSYLGGDIATILILLDSLRNAFLADMPPTSSTERPPPTLPSISSFDSKSPSHVTRQEIVKTTLPVVVDTRRLSRIIAQNPEMEREIRIAYDELCQQTRLLEKKVESLEVKSKYANTLDKKQQEECNSPTHSDVLSSSVLSEEEEEEEEEFDED